MLNCNNDYGLKKVDWPLPKNTIKIRTLTSSIQIKQQYHFISLPELRRWGPHLHSNASTTNNGMIDGVNKITR